LPNVPADWRLVYGDVDLPFGSIGSGYVFPSPPEIGSPDLTNDDARRARADGVLFGQDTRGGTTVAFDVDVVAADEAAVLSKLAPLAAAWRADSIRSTPGATATLVADTGRVTFGRPRRFAHQHTYRKDGLIQVTADFATADDLWYGPERSTSVSLVPTPSGGLLAPLASPLSTTRTSDRSQVFEVDGELPTWPVFTVRGPITNPVVEVTGVLRIAVTRTLAYDQTLVIDTRPWARSVLLDGASIGGAVSPTSTRLSRAAVPPGVNEATLRGASANGTATLSVAWRPAFHTP